MLTCSMKRFISLLQLGLCPRVVCVVMWSVCEVVVVPNVDVVVAVTVMCVLLSVFHVTNRCCMFVSCVHPVAVSAFIICSGLCDCTELL